MSSKNKLIIAAAGSGKTTHLVDKALKEDGNVLITTFTEANEGEIKKKLLKRVKYIPKNIVVQTWFSFLLHHGVRPYQGEMDNGLFSKKIGFFLFEGKSGKRYEKNGKPIYWGEDDLYKYYFTNDLKIYSDKIAKFVIECNQRVQNEVINRISRIYSHIYIDEVQDLAGWDLEILKLLFKSNSNAVLVGDPRQSTYTTNDSSKYKKYRGKIQEFVSRECSKGVCEIDTESLNVSHRNCQAICDFSSRLYPEYAKCEPCCCIQCRKHPADQGVFLVKLNDIESFRTQYNNVVELCDKESIPPAINFGASKGLGFDRVLIYPTEKIRKYLKSGNITEIESIKAKFYVALTRAKYGVGIVCDYDDYDYIEGLVKYRPISNVV